MWRQHWRQQWQPCGGGRGGEAAKPRVAQQLKTFNKTFCRGGVGVEVLEVFWEELWLHFFWPTFWLHCILYRTYTGGEAPPISKIQNSM